MDIKENRKILALLVALILLFMSLIAYLSYFTVFQAEEIIDNPANRRGMIQIAKIKRGTIYDRNGEILASSEGEQGKYTRNYPFNNLYSHIVGYSNKVVGNTALESSFNKELLGMNNPIDFSTIKSLVNKSYKKDLGNDLHLTLNTNIQEKARDLLDDLGEKGSIVVMNPKTGEILSMVSYPDFNPNTVEKDYSKIVDEDNGAFYNKSIQGGYAPGSTFKIITASSIIENGINQKYKDTGEESFGEHSIRNAGGEVYGNIDLEDAFTNSVNTYFANKAMELGNIKLGTSAESFMFNKKIDFDLDTSTSKFSVSKFPYKDYGREALAASGIGQATINATPLQMALVTSTIANEGKMMQPYIVQQVVRNDGHVIKDRKAEVLAEPIKPETANEIKDMMINVVKRGSGKSARLRSTLVAGKTGTAQRSAEKDIYDAWFVGFAPADDPQVAVAIVVQNVNRLGGQVAAPIARDIISYSLRELKD